MRALVCIENVESLLSTVNELLVWQTDVYDTKTLFAERILVSLTGNEN